ncbi:MAG: sulfurtransferase [Hyphomicrobiaceae bacterium]|nr:sulfurtransferase [Hyphomicrobiaceae bacterium]
MSRPLPNPAPLASVETLASELGDPRLRIYDCTTFLHPTADGAALRVESGRAGYAEGHIPGAAFLDLATELSDTSSPYRFALLDPAAFATAAGRLGIGDGTRVVLYDRTYGAWGARVWWMLKGYGFDDARVLDGGLTNWKRKGLAVETKSNIYPASTLTVAPRAGHFADKAEVKAAIGRADSSIVNALLPEQHRGTGGVHYGRPGRIPGSCNVPSRGIVDPDTQALLPAEELHRRFAEQGLLDGRRVIAYCGGGIAASLTALALTALGAKDVGVYMNSMQEWTRDQSCPMERD